MCFTIFLLSKKINNKRCGGYDGFPKKLICFMVPNHYLDEPFCVSNSFGYRNLSLIKEWGSTIFCWFVSVSHSARTSRRGTRLCSKNFLISKTIEEKRERERERERAGVRIFPRNLCSHSTEIIRRGTLHCFRKFKVSKKCMDQRSERAGVTIFHRNLLVFNTKTFLRRNFLPVTILLESERINNKRGRG